MNELFADFFGPVDGHGPEYAVYTNGILAAWADKIDMSIPLRDLRAGCGPRAGWQVTCSGTSDRVDDFTRDEMTAAQDTDVPVTIVNIVSGIRCETMARALPVTDRDGRTAAGFILSGVPALS
jgi:hypothetical protein